MEILDIINNAKEGDNINAGKAFNSVMADKLQTALDAKKIEIASTMIQRKTAEQEED